MSGIEKITTKAILPCSPKIDQSDLADFCKLIARDKTSGSPQTQIKFLQAL
jgi:hypothetical protein